MSARRCVLIASLFALFSLFTVGSLMAASPDAAPAALVTAAGDGVRVIGDADTARVRLEIFTLNGALVYDSGWRSGNLLDWFSDDMFGHALNYGAYRFTVATAGLSGNEDARRSGVVRLAADGATVESESSAATSATSIVRLAHDGAQGQVLTTEGALSFRFGDFLARKDVEAMRLSPDGALDVMGVIRPRQGIQFPDGTIQRTAATPGLLRFSGSLHPSTNVAGTGTTNKVTKWTDTQGTLGDSNISEVNGKVGIGTLTPGAPFHVFGAPTADVFAGLGPDVIAGPAMNYGYAGASFGRGAGFFNVRPDAGALAPNPSLRFETLNQQRIIITNLGNIGINTGFTPATAPTEKLEINGNVKLLGTGKLIFPDASFMTTAGATLGANTFTGNQTVNGNVMASGVISAGTEYQINGARILGNTGAANLFAGISAGAVNTTGAGNSFFGSTAGSLNQIGNDNSYFGFSAGQINTKNANAFFGSKSGRNVDGAGNTFVGEEAGLGQTGATATYNVGVGYQSGFSLTTGTLNTFVGIQAGYSTTTGFENVAIGYGAGGFNFDRNDDIFVGSYTGGDAVTNATAIGTRAYVARDNSIVLGSIQGVNQATASTNVGIGQTSPYTTLHVRADAPGTLGPILTLMNGGAATGAGAGIDFDGLDTGVNAPSLRIQSADDGAFSSDLIFLTKNQGAITNPIAERMRLTSTGILSINNSTPDANVKLHVNGKIHLDALGSAGSESLCRNSNNVIGTCGASSIRLKDNVADYSHGIDLIRRLRPVSFTWKSNHKEDFGLIAEEVEKVEPRLSVYDSNGVVEGVRYDRLTPLLISAVTELADDRDRLKHENDDLRERLAAVERAIAKLAPEK